MLTVIFNVCAMSRTIKKLVLHELLILLLRIQALHRHAIMYWLAIILIRQWAVLR